MKKLLFISFNFILIFIFVSCSSSVKIMTQSSANTSSSKTGNSVASASISQLTSSSSSFINNNSKVSSQTTSKIITTWSYKGVAKLNNSNDNQPVYGLEFKLLYNSQKKEFIFEPGMGDSDKIDYFIITNHSITVAINQKHELKKDWYPSPIGAYVIINRDINANEGFGNSNNESTIYQNDEKDNLISINFDKDFNEGKINDLFFSWGKID